MLGRFLLTKRIGGECYQISLVCKYKLMFYDTLFVTGHSYALEKDFYIRLSRATSLQIVTWTL